jgi:hypothetical protein
VDNELNRLMALERTARFQRDADRSRQARAANIRPPQPVRTAIELRLSACREDRERRARRLGAAGRSTE